MLELSCAGPSLQAPAPHTTHLCIVLPCPERRGPRGMGHAWALTTTDATEHPSYNAATYARPNKEHPRAAPSELRRDFDQGTRQGINVPSDVPIWKY
jgi:hypothetical protein